ncbi:uncharacterized protein TrAFT101_009509 [Trichoderma asperellum]|uniref:uncharacterized protein n=1 Tax=Trichoderma asperellum TaxID=101201 RepID=UPI00332244C8|nr:hypothetical protein TrAFT101_009509 [Trichoderma asperellum]
MGCEVAVFSTTEQKRAEALAFRASEFYPTRDVGKLEIRAPIDHLLVTANAQPDWSLYLLIMALEGTVYPITVSFNKIAVPAMDLIMGGLRNQGEALQKLLDGKMRYRGVLVARK